MSEERNQTYQKLRPGAIVAIALMLGSGGGYRLLAERYARPVESVKLPKGALARLPMEIGDWSGRDVAIDAEIIRVTDTDDHVNRVYRRAGTIDAVSMFIGYGIRFRDLVPHRPEVCYPDNGWTMVESRKIEVSTPAGAPVQCQLHNFRRGGALTTEKVSVLNYYYVDGQYTPDVTLLRTKAFQTGLSDDDVHFAVQVQITSGADRGFEHADDAVQAFAADVGPMIAKLLDDAIAQIIAAAPAT